MSKADSEKTILSQLFAQGSLGADQQAQEGVGEVDHAQMQGKMSPQEAMQTLGAQLFPGPKGSNSYIQKSEANTGLGRLLGITHKTQVPMDNFFDAIKEAGIEKYLPDGIQRTPEGKPYVSPENAQKALQIAQSFGPKTRAAFYQHIGFDPDTKEPVVFNSASGKFMKGDKEVPPSEISRVLSKTKPQLSEGQTNDITNLLNAKTQLNEVKKLFDPSAVGPVQARLLDFQNSTGIKLPDIQGLTKLTDERVKLRTMMSSSINDYIKAITGAQMSEIEARRIMKALPDPNASEEAFMPALNEIVRLTDLKLGNRIAVLKSQGVVGIDDIEKLANNAGSGSSGSSAPKAAPAPKGPDFNSLEGLKAAYQAGQISLEQAKALGKAMQRKK